jgi:hypothetical protein
MAFIGQVRKKGLELRRTHFCGMTQMVKADVEFCPMDIDALGAKAIMLVT